MPWAAPIVGYSDRVGRLRCSSCAAEDQRQHAIPGDTWFGIDDVCEVCGWKFQHIKSLNYVHIEWGDNAPDLRRSNDRQAV